jgi:hypothetical protein
MDKNILTNLLKNIIYKNNIYSDINTKRQIDYLYVISNYFQDYKINFTLQHICLLKIIDNSLKPLSTIDYDILIDIIIYKSKEYRKNVDKYYYKIDYYYFNIDYINDDKEIEKIDYVKPNYTDLILFFELYNKNIFLNYMISYLYKKLTKIINHNNIKSKELYYHITMNDDIKATEIILKKTYTNILDHLGRCAINYALSYDNQYLIKLIYTNGDKFNPFVNFWYNCYRED